MLHLTILLGGRLHQKVRDDGYGMERKLNNNKLMCAMVAAMTTLANNNSKPTNL